MKPFLLTTVRSSPQLFEIVPGFLYASTPPTHLRNTRDVIVFFDGYLTNLTSLRHVLQTHDLSCEEIIAALYIRDQGFSTVTGHFSAVVVDLRRRTLVGITDRHCVGELYYHVDQQGDITIAPRFPQLLPYSRRRLNEFALACYFSLGDIERQDTFLDDIGRITQFYTLYFDRRLTIKNDYLPLLSSINVDSTRGPKDLLDHLESLLRKHISDLTIEYGRLCNTLSGGVDSSYLQALLLERQHAHSFSIAFEASGQDNVYAADVARYLRTTHDAITFNANDFLNYIERGISVTGKPYMYQGEAMFLKLYGHIAQRLPHAMVISGQTADGALDSALPKPIRIALQLTLMPQQLLDLFLGYISGEWRGLVADLRAATISSVCLPRIERRSATCQRVTRYLGSSHDVYHRIAAMANGFSGEMEDKLAKTHLYSGEMRRIPNMLHALAQSVGLRIAFPFLEPAFLEYTLTIPATLKRRKYLGKKLAERHLTRSYVHRPKISKGVPYRRLFTQEEQWVDRLNAIRRSGFYGFDIDDMIGSEDYLLLLRLINFDIWTRDVMNSCVTTGVNRLQ
jgi:asparagine synthetase B (glutamine-hydrolysing)